MEMTPEGDKPMFMHRAQVELSGLVQMITALEKFTMSDTYTNMPYHHQYLLNEQLRAMRDYGLILEARVSILKMENLAGVLK